jgi:cytochrome c biogenesis protein CcmG/thiol:disulfide interchange protein DsbE
MRLVSTGLVALALGSAACASGAPAPAMPSAQASLAHPLVGKPAPEFARPTLDGQQLRTEALHGKPLVVKFFAKYCEPCKRTLPAAQRLHRARGDVVVIGIAEDEDAATAADLARTYGLSFPVVHDQGNVLAGRFRVSDLPVTFVIDGQGRVRHVLGPGQTERDLVAAIEQSR